MQFLLDGGMVAGDRLLSEKTIADFYAPQISQGLPATEILNPLTGVSAYCLGWGIHSYEGHQIVEHPGFNFGKFGHCPDAARSHRRLYFVQCHLLPRP